MVYFESQLEHFKLFLTSSFDCYENIKTFSSSLVVGEQRLGDETFLGRVRPGETIGMSNEVTLHSGHCREYTQTGLNSAFGSITI